LQEQDRLHHSVEGEKSISRSDSISAREDQKNGTDEDAKRFSSEPSRLELDRSRESTLKWEDYLIGLLLQNPALSPYICGIITYGDFAGTDTRELYRILNSIYQRDASPSLQPFEKFVPSALLPAASRAIGQAASEVKSLEDGTSLVRQAVDCAYRLKRARLV